MQPATPPSDFPILKPSTPAGKQAAKLHREWVDQHDRAKQVEVDFIAAQNRLTESQAELRDVLARREMGNATDEEATAAEDAHRAAKAEVDAPWRERAIAAVEASEKRRADYERFVDDKLDDLVTELEVDAQAAVTTIREAAQTMADGVAAWRETRKRAIELIRPAQLVDGQSVPGLTASAEAAAIAATRLLADGDGLVLPVPGRRHLDQRRIDLGLKPLRSYHWNDGGTAATADGGSEAGDDE